MTGSTCESKAKSYAAEAVNEVATQYTSTLSNMTTDLGAKDDQIAKLQLQLKQLQQTPEADAVSNISTPSILRNDTFANSSMVHKNKRSKVDRVNYGSSRSSDSSLSSSSPLFSNHPFQTASSHVDNMSL